MWTDVKSSTLSMFLMLVPIVPTVSLYTTIMVFILPAESGERVSFCITVLLAFAVFLTIAGDNLPKVSKPMPMICNFLIVNLTLSTFICIMTILNLRLFHKPESEPVPRFLAAIAQKFNGRCTSINETLITKRVKASSKLETELDQVGAADEKFVAAVDWKKFSGMVDTVLCIFCSIWLITSFIIFIGMMQFNQSII
ncbi:hypothetical protein ACJMK2_019530 [Sinanodonta woodiana]|uniref:Neurotransmitter-gated ion-channel transmembrane domain-containing protein n=1 Tax=Sinanodonta woodiana TaxID=1069815 RepID=A0ABD3TYU4_SINWO